MGKDEANKAMDHIVVDETGTLVSGIFFVFEIPFDDVIDDSDVPDSWIVVPRLPTSDDLFLQEKDPWTWIKLVLDSDDWIVERFCTTHAEHTRRWRIKSGLADVFGGSQLSEFIPSGSYQKIVVCESFTDRLRHSGMTGYDLVRLSVHVDQTRDFRPVLFAVEPKSQNFLRLPRLRGIANACPFCGQAPLICPECGQRVIRCSNCEKVTAILRTAHTGKSDRRLKIQPAPQAGPILEGVKWNGSDFINCGWNIITKRAVDWLLSTHAAPFVARPARVCIDGMSKQQLEWLDRAKQPLPVLMKK